MPVSTWDEADDKLKSLVVDEGLRAAIKARLAFGDEAQVVRLFRDTDSVVKNTLLNLVRFGAFI